MTHFNSKEEQFKDILANLELGLDTESIWDEVRHQLPKKNDDYKLPLPFWFLSGLFLFSFIGIIGVGFFQETQSSVIISQNEVSNANQEVFSASKEYEDAIEKIASQKENISEALTLSSGAHNVLQNNQLQNQSSKSIQERKASNNNIVDRRLREEITSTSTAQKSYPNSVNQSAEISKLLNIPSQKNIQKTTSQSVSFPTANSEELTRIEQLPILQTHGLDISRKTASEYLTPQIQPFKNGNRLSFSYSLLSGVNSGISTYYGPSLDSENNNEYTRLEGVSEMDMPGLSNAFLISAEYGAWRFFSGLKHNYTAARYEREKLIIQAEERTSSNGSAFTSKGISKESERWHRLHNTIDLQLGLGYSFVASSKYKVSANLGASINLYTNNKGYFLKEHLFDITTYEAGEENPYKTKRGIGGEFNLILERRIGEKLSLALMPSISTVLNPINNNTIHYKLKNSQIGLQIGISYRPVWE